MEMEQEVQELSTHQLLENSQDGPTIPDYSMFVDSHSSGGEEPGGRKAEWREDGGGRAGEPDEEYGNVRQTEKLIEDD
ncbi:hypothetical protein WISP_91331 [Willisornis vidua]|uniref:Uncharacterized protein n=1 Tax=Willisornis vidua TaxID=1566151 RepID=A0ABQ9D1C9_9PASS|nr:hypothetical protein WISP_91331 [Willisornis vidua]